MLRSARILTLSLALVVALLAVGPSAASARCKAGVHPFGKLTARTFCGPATAKVTVDGVTTSYKGGRCTRTGTYLTINIGTAVLGQTKKKRPPYFGITVGKPASGTPAPTDGTYTGAAVAFVITGASHALLGSSVTLAAHRTKGTFSGSLIGPDTPVTGSFRCG